MKDILIRWAETYECKEFIPTDPIQFAHRFPGRKDCEIAAFIVSWFTYGNRKQIIKKGNELMNLMNNQPYDFISSCKWKEIKNYENSFYRFYKYYDLFDICERLHIIYSQYETLEDCLYTHSTDPVKAIREVFAGIKGFPPVSTLSACKKINMFLRWVVRQNSPVDLGIWKKFHARDLIIPLDTHVHNMSIQLKLTGRKSADYKTALEITDFFRDLFPEDPCKGDFSLFGFSVNKGELLRK